MTLIWTNVVGFEGRYAVSDQGTVMALKGRRRGRVLRGTVKPSGYHVVTLMLPDGSYVPRYSHRLVCEAFHGTPTKEKPWVCHGNAVRADNRAANLRWGSPLDNAADAIAHGSYHNRRGLRCEDIQSVFRYLDAGETQAEVGRRFGVTQSTISLIKVRKRHFPCYECGAKCSTPTPIDEV